MLKCLRRPLLVGCNHPNDDIIDLCSPDVERLELMVQFYDYLLERSQTFILEWCENYFPRPPGGAGASCFCYSRKEACLPRPIEAFFSR